MTECGNHSPFSSAGVSLVVRLALWATVGCVRTGYKSIACTTTSTLLPSLSSSSCRPSLLPVRHHVCRRWAQKVHHRLCLRQQHRPQQGRILLNLPLPAMLRPPLPLDAGTGLRPLLLPRAPLRRIIISSLNRRRHPSLGLFRPRRPALLSLQPHPRCAATRR